MVKIEKIVDFVRTGFRNSFTAPPALPENEVALAALERHKREGMQLAVRARLVALVIISLMLPILIPRVEVFYYYIFTVLFAFIGWAQLRVASIGRNRSEFLLLVADLILLTIVILVPNPFSVFDFPLEMQYRFHGHAFFFIFLALGTLAYSWRTVRAYITVATVAWLSGAGLIWFFSSEHELSQVVRQALVGYPLVLEILDPGSLRFDLRFQEIVLFAVVAFILSMTVQRFGELLLTHAAVERERANLTRYFSPNMVDELSHNDEPLKQIRTQNVAVMFVDIVGFTGFSEDRTPEDVIITLREFHGLMEKAVFSNGGTLDKFLGDGLMATFGTPVAGSFDAHNALKCAKDMIDFVDQWNAERDAKNLEPVNMGVGLHYGPCVLGDIGGANRLEFAVIGDTVNVASRVEAKTRELGVRILMTQQMIDQVGVETSSADELLQDFNLYENQTIRGIEKKVSLRGAGALMAS